MITCLMPSSIWATGKAAAVRETVELVMRKFGREAAEVGVETLTRKIESLVLRHGDEVLTAVNKVGPRAIHAIEQAGEQRLAAAKLLARYGDGAA